MSSYRSNYVQWKGGSAGIGSSSYSPASSTSSLASSTSTSGSTTNKFSSSLNVASSSNYKTTDSRIPSRETSFVSGTGTSSANTSAGRLGGRYSALSSKADSLSSANAAASTSSYGSSNLSSGNKTNLNFPSTTTTSKDVKSPGYGLAPVSSLSSKFSAPTNSCNTNSFRSGTSNSYLRTPSTSSSTNDNATQKSKITASSENASNNTKPQSSTCNTATTTNKSADSPGGYGQGHGTTNSYRPYPSRAGSDLTLGTSAVSSALRTTARFGLRSGTSHSHYNSLLPTSSTLKAAVALAGETKKELHKIEKKVEDTGPVTWKSRGTSTKNSSTDSETEKQEACTDDGISKEEIPSFEPRVFSPRYDGVLKHRGIQTEEEPKPKILPSSIPRPTLALNYYSGAYGSGLRGRYEAKTSSNQSEQTNDKNDVTTTSTSTSSSISELKSSNSNPKLKTHVGSSGKEKDSNNSSNSKTCTGSGLNNKRDNATPGTLTSGCDQSSPRSSQQTINNKIAETIAATKTTTNATNEDQNNESDASPASGVVRINVANKEFRKSALNIDLNSKDSQEDFTRKQEELRLQKSLSKSAIQKKSDSVNNTTLPANDDKSTSVYSNSALSSTASPKRDVPRRPPTDLSKLPIVNNYSQNQSIPQATGTNINNDSVKINAEQAVTSAGHGLMKMRSSKSINQLRKLSSASTSSTSESESCSSLSTSSSSSSKKTEVNKKVKKASLNNHNLDNKAQCRRGSATSCSSTASSRSNSVENNTNNKSNKTGSANNSTNLSSQSKPPSGAASSIKAEPRPTKDLMKCKSTNATTQIQNKESEDAPFVPTQTSFLSRSLLRKCDSGELPWWMKSNQDVSQILGTKPSSSSDISSKDALNNDNSIQTDNDNDESESDVNVNVVLGERTAPDGASSLFIGSVANIDDILGTVSPSLVVESPSPAPTVTNANPLSVETLCEAQRKLSLNHQSGDEDSEDSEDSSENEESFDDNASSGTSSSFEACGINEDLENMQRRISYDVDATAHSMNLTKLIPEDKQKQLDDATLQLYKDGEFGTYMDLESSITEQQEDFEGFLDNRKNSIVLRAQLPVRVHAIIEKLLNADGRELRRALFSLKQIFQEDKDLVHEFVQNGGLNCLIKVGSEADQNYQNYILRAIGQVMLYVDGMYGVMRHNETIQWLYNLVASKFRLVQKTALKLLLVFVDYVESNCILLVQAVTSVDNNKGLEAWSNVMNLLREQDSNSGDTELLVYAMTLVNKVLNGIPDIDVYYDQVDALEEQGMANIIQSYMGKQCADLDLLKQFQIYELVLKHEDGEEDNIMMQLDENMRNKLLSRKGYNETDSSRNGDRRKSRRHSTSTPPGAIVPPFPRRLSSADENLRDSPFSSLSSSSSLGTINGPVIPNVNLELTPGLRRRRERADHQKNLILEQLVNGVGVNGDTSQYADLESPPPNSTSPEYISLLRLSNGSRKDLNSLELQNNLRNSVENNTVNGTKPWMLPIYTKSNGMANSSASISNGTMKDSENGHLSDSEKSEITQKRENTVKDLTQKLASQNLLSSPAEENKSFMMTGELSGVVLKAKEGLAKSKSRADMKPQVSDSTNVANKGAQLEVKLSDNELHWNFLVSNLQRPLEICDLDFTDLKTSDDEDILAPDPSHTNNDGFPPPAPTMNGHPPPPPPSVGKYGAAPPPPGNGLGFGSPLFGVNLKSLNNNNSQTTETTQVTTSKKTKKTVKLFWKEVREDPVTASKLQKVGCIWNEIQMHGGTPIDTQSWETLFESRAKDLISKGKCDANKTKEIVVLDPKRSNAINIGMTKLPPPRTIKAAIMKMDSTIINREGIEKLLAMLPEKSEIQKITEAQFANPETPLGSAEQFLLTLASISELTARLKLWAFKLDYENLEREVAEPLMDLKTGTVALEKNNTFRYILATLLSIGNFLNGGDAKGFQIEYLSKVPEVKDTVQKHSLLHHLCQTVNENYPDSTDLYSEIGPVTRASRVDFDEIYTNLAKMENDCKTSWDYLRLIAKHDGPTNLKLKLSEFLADCAERIIVLGMIHRRIMNRFHKFLLWLGISAHQVTTTKPHTLFKVISEFALEYRTTRERVIQQLQKKANHRERNKTRGKMITEQIMYKSKEDKEDAELRQLLSKTSNGTDDAVRGSLTWSRRQKGPPSTQTTPTNTIYHNFSSRTSTLSSNGTLDDGDDEILESLVKTATRTSDTRVANRERKRNNGTVRNNAERKSLRRTLRHGLSEEERKMLAAFMASGHTFACS